MVVVVVADVVAADVVVISGGKVVGGAGIDVSTSSMPLSWLLPVLQLISSIPIVIINKFFIADSFC